MINFLVTFILGALSAAAALAAWVTAANKARAKAQHDADVLRRREVKLTHGFNLIKDDLNKLKSQLSEPVALPSAASNTGSAHTVDGTRAADSTFLQHSTGGAVAISGGPVC
jgi:hypothetical protein